jgi:hypothetical protein
MCNIRRLRVGKGGAFLFFVVHVVQVIIAGWNNFRAMVTGFEIHPVMPPTEDPVVAENNNGNIEPILTSAN